jgi:hypothetical protein
MFSITNGAILAREWKWIIAGVTTFLVMLMILMTGVGTTTPLDTSQLCNVPTSLTGNGNAEQSWNFFINQGGITPAGAAGILGNLMQESGIDPTRSGGGLAQWSDPTRWSHLQQYAKQNHADPNALGTQLGFLMQELLSGNYGSIAALNRSSTPAQAAEYFEQNFEAAGKPMMDRRIAYANGFYNEFEHMNVTPSGLPVCSASTTVSGNIQNVLNIAESYLNKHTTYVFGGGRTPQDIAAGIFDCSSWIREVYFQAGINLGPLTGTTTTTLALAGTAVSSKADLKPGDLVFWNTYEPNGHVGIYLGNDEAIACNTGKGVSLINMDSSYYAPILSTTMRRIIN